MERPEKSYYDTLFDTNMFRSPKEREAIKKQWMEYINDKYKVGYSEETTCTALAKGGYHHFGIIPKAAYMYGDRPEDVIKCKVTIIEDNVNLKKKYQSNYDANSTDYFGWIDYDDNDDKKCGIHMIQPNIKVFSVQFAGGGDYEVSKGAGKIVRLKVEIL